MEHQPPPGPPPPPAWPLPPGQGSIPPPPPPRPLPTVAGALPTRGLRVAHLVAMTEGVLLLLAGVPAAIFVGFAHVVGGFGLLRPLGLGAAIVTVGVLLVAAARALASLAAWARWTIVAAQCVLVVGAPLSVPVRAVSSWPA